MPVKDSSIPKVKVEAESERVFRKSHEKWRNGQDLKFSAWVREACIEKACRDGKKTKRQLFPWLF